MRKIWNDPRYRPLQVAICTVLILFLIIALYISWGCPTLSIRQEFRRAEKAHLVGPSKIVDTVTDVYKEFDKMILGETAYGICFFGRYEVYTGNNRKETSYHFTYREKTGDLTVAAAPNIYGVFWNIQGYSLPVYLFDEYPQAIRAELEITVSSQYDYYWNGTPKTLNYAETFRGNATRTEEGYFRFNFTSNSEEQSHALAKLSNVACGGAVLDEDRAAVFPATVRLYDSQNNLILEKELEITA